MENINQIKNELELQVLSVMLNDPESIPAIMHRVKADDFSNDNKFLFLKVIELSSIKDSINLIIQLSKANIQEWTLSELNKLQSKGNEFSLERLYFNKVFEQIKDIATAERVKSICKAKLNTLKTDSRGLDAAIELKSEIEEVIKGIEVVRDDKSFSDNLPDILEMIEGELNSTKNNSISVQNLPSFNNATGGLRVSNLLGIAGAYKSGKTTLGLNIILDLAKQNIPCGFFSLELSEDELNRKILGMLSKVEYENLRDPKKLDDNAKNKIDSLFKKKLLLPLYTSDKLMTEQELKAKARYWKERFGVKVICIDYLGYIRSNKKFDTREREMSYYSGFLKQVAKELDIVVIVLAQLNRQGRKEATTENLAESIALARDCDFLFITFNPLVMGIKKDKNIEYNESHFIVKLDTTRHTRFKKQFLLKMNDDGNFIEIATEYDNEYLNALMKEQEEFIF
ncbi:MAG: AAA family ATPase [Chitinophagales bacterium]|nr:AAA family ATPase [Chitinophagales bacterium]